MKPENENEVVARKGEWEIHRDEFKNALVYAFIEPLMDNSLIVCVATNYAQIKWVKGEVRTNKAIILSNKEDLVLVNTINQYGKPEYLVESTTKLKYIIVSMTDEIKDCWNNIIKERMLGGDMADNSDNLPNYFYQQAKNKEKEDE